MLRNILAYDGKVTATINNGVLVSLKRGNFEYFHGADKPEKLKEECDKRGWKNSEIVMFPVIGSVRDFEIDLPGEGKFPMDQHGISRHLPFRTDGHWSHFVRFVQRYASQAIPNPRAESDNGRPSELKWPFSFRLYKQFELGGGQLYVDFIVQNLSDINMRYNLGWHPAFRFNGDVDEGRFLYGIREISLMEVIQECERNRSVKLEGVSKVMYVTRGYKKKARRGGSIVVESIRGFNDTMLWSPGADSRMFCIEPVSNIPVSAERQAYFQTPPFEEVKARESKEYRACVRVN